ncbi:hypothetical protein [Candidatus Palauibacter sp.]|uniref:hypothetical protein n=1 Tax=Candidatus Palauibacter sp. TaxID=3101350 RepID=UPI003B010184
MARSRPLSAIWRTEKLTLTNNSSMSGALPASLQSLDRLALFLAGGTELCVPDDPALLQWLETVTTRRVLRCPTGERSRAYLTQAVQSLEFPVPLVADEAALLRVFVTAAQATNATIPPVKARFYHGGSEVHVMDIGAGTEPIPIEVKEGALEKSANAEVPGCGLCNRGCRWSSRSIPTTPWILGSACKSASPKPAGRQWT